MGNTSRFSVFVNIKKKLFAQQVVNDAVKGVKLLFRHLAAHEDVAQVDDQLVASFFGFEVAAVAHLFFNVFAEF